jgi:hypothetical protein
MSNNTIKQVVGILIVVGVVVGGVVLLRRNNQGEEVMPEINLEPTMQMTEELPEPMSMTEKQSIEEKFVSEGVEMIVLKDVAQGQAVGTGWRHYDGEEFVFKSEASGLIELEKGFFYEGWLVGKDGFFSTGRLPVVDGKGTLYYQSDENKSEYDGVVLTLEAEDGNEAPDKHILEGSF